MKNGLMGFAAFAAGGAIGFLTAKKLLKDQYEQRVQDEVDSVKAAFKKMHPLAAKKPEKDQPTDQERKQYSQYAAQLGYTEEKKPAPMLAPHVISPDEYGEMDEYDQISLTYYADGTLTDDADRAMSEDEIEETVGKESLNHFGEYEEDSVFVRNDRLKADYEILTDPSTYAEVLKDKPYLIK